MSEPLIGSLQPFGFNWAPVNWIICAGQELAIADYTSLYSLIHNTYGGDGRINFALPDLRGRDCVGSGQGPGTHDYVWGTRSGHESVILETENLPVHNHPMESGVLTISATTTVAAATIDSVAEVQSDKGSNNTSDPTNAYYGANGANDIYNVIEDGATMAADMVEVTTTLDKLDLTTTGTANFREVGTDDTGSSAAFSNLENFQVIGCYAIAADGVYPPRN